MQAMVARGCLIVLPAISESGLIGGALVQPVAITSLGALRWGMSEAGN
jgi:hypothetical protein